MEVRVVMSLVLTTFLLHTSDCLNTRGGTPDGSEEWGYIPVRPQASLFYWFYKTTHPDGHLNRPIVLWLQGGPGFSATGLGNFLMLGPLDQNLESRNYTWIQTANILFVDSPAGAGFSVADRIQDIGYNVEGHSIDLLFMLLVFMREHRFYQNTPFYIFGQNYGGKIAAAFAHTLNQAIRQREIRCNLRAVAIGNGWVSPIDLMLNWAPMMYQMSVIDDVQYEEFNELAQEALVAEGRGQWGEVQGRLFRLLGRARSFETLNLYNVVNPHIVVPDRSQRTPRSIYDLNITEFMNSTVRDKLGIIPAGKTWNDKYALVYLSQEETRDLVKPVVSQIDDLLKTSNVDVIIYQGQLDIWCNTVGTLQWMQKLTWSAKVDFDSADRRVLVNEESLNPEMYVKSHGPLKMYWILNSGHVVPVDAPDVALKMLNRILDDVD